MTAHHRAKGRQGERDVATLLTRAGFPASRNEANQGYGNEDVAHAIPGIWLEVKRVERLDLPGALRQAKAQADKRNLTPLVVHRSNRQSWKVTMEFEYLLSLLRVCMLGASTEEGSR